MSRKLLAVVAIVAAGAAAWYVLRPPQSPPPPAARLPLNPGDRVAVVGNGFAEGMLYHGHFETRLHARHPEHRLVVRNLGYAGDEVTTPPTRAVGHLDHGTTRLEDVKPDVVIACYGMNESFAGADGLAAFEDALNEFAGRVITTPFNGRAPPKLVLVSPIAHENTGRPGFPDGAAHTEVLKQYAEAVGRVAAKSGSVFVDLFEPSRRLMAEHKLTTDGIRPTDAGDKLLAAALDEALFGPHPTGGAEYEALRTAVNDKSLHVWYDTRPAQGNFIYGSHKTGVNQPVFKAEFAKLRKMIELRDARVWDIAAGKPVPPQIDDSPSGTLPPVESKFGPARVPTTAETLKAFTTAPGFEVTLFASEEQFPELKKPVAMTFDARGRLWVNTWPSYPLHRPGDAPPDDKVLILDDPQGTGKAATASVFARGLYLPTGLAVGDGGAYVGCPPDVWFLREGGGRERVLPGFGNADTHRALTTFRWGPGGELYFDEGVYNYSQVETPYGVRRSFNGAVWRYDARAGRLDAHVAYKFGNPWGHAFDRWGQEFVADAADGSTYFATPFSGQTDYPRQHPPLKTMHEKQWRPTAGCVVASGRHFPDDWRGDLLVNNTMGVKGVLRFRLSDAGSGFVATPADPLLVSADPAFCPVDIAFGPDGALYVCDWSDAVTNYIAVPLRDPSRDHTHGRIWRVAAKGRPPAPRPTIDGAPVAALFDLLKAPEDATRDLARRELRLRDAKEVSAAADRWAAALNTADPDFAHHQLEALWACQHADAVNEPLLRAVLKSAEPRSRAAATRVLCAWRDRLPDALGLLGPAARDDHPRVRLEAVRALSFFRTRVARDLAAAVAVPPGDDYLRYAVDETLATLDERLRR
ncbi:PVC-type heme-binding CxxCH protein [Urbifossiella limnaea]|uniref:Uncharacterized protein n=1 Tax=Urbifossiella limnaea TaxID=2528023 RepID=A0A517XM01_9BACT|nr:PVC-type heme-binding CxxCH protein [Urbifossiella limnaea]QDU18541.1 hypothetical protein ETAA1_04330 [Urbifossiella limnaea]